VNLRVPLWFMHLNLNHEGHKVTRGKIQIPKLLTAEIAEFTPRTLRSSFFSAISELTLRPLRLNAFAFALLLFLFFRERRIHFQQTFGQIHLYALVLEIDPLQKYLSIWNLVLMLSRSHYQ
jgi:hypothetical protein